MKKSKTSKKTVLRTTRSAVDETGCVDIALAAYSIWEQEGRPEGRNVEHWREAEAQIRATHDLDSCQG